jgi:hypothetical protein
VFERVDVRGLGEDSRRAILERVKGKLGFNKTLEALGISKGSLHNYLHGVRGYPTMLLVGPSGTLRSGSSTRSLEASIGSGLRGSLGPTVPWTTP